MPIIRLRVLLLVATLLFVFFGPLSLGFGPVIATDAIPSRLTDEAFWNMVTEFSEPSGYFRSDNFVSNEATFQYVLKRLSKTRPGGVYLGVGPDQNFTYIVSMKPKLAIIVDIRRQNAMLHLMYKALIETSSDRADFLSKLFSRVRPQNLGAGSTAEELFAAFEQVEPDRQLFLENLDAIKRRLKEQHQFKLSPDDEAGIHYVYSSFYAGGPHLTYSGVSGFGRTRMPSYAELMDATDEEGVNRSYMGTEENFKALQEFQNNNLIVPLVGDFAGPKTIRAVAAYLRQNAAFVGAFYLSNVEQYLFQQNDDWGRFYRNIQTLPLDGTSMFIRSVFNNTGFTFQSNSYDLRSASLLSSIPELLQAFQAGQVRTYYDVINLSR
jgi:hypothetical protein